MISLDNTVRSYLVSKGYTLHYYVQALQYAIDCTRELNFDSLRNIVPITLKVNSYKAADLPCDYVDYVKVGSPTGEYIYPMVEKNTLNRLRNYNANGQPIPYPDVLSEFGWNVFGFPLWTDGFGYYYWYWNNIDTHGEFYGRLFNHVPTYQDCFEIIAERNQIQLDISYNSATVYMEYISNGLGQANINCNSQTMITEYAYAAVKDYIHWQMQANAHGNRIPLAAIEQSKQQYYNSLRITRARKFSITPEMVKMAFRKNYTAAIKS